MKLKRLLIYRGLNPSNGNFNHLPSDQIRQLNQWEPSELSKINKTAKVVLLLNYEGVLVKSQPQIKENQKIW